MPADDAPLQPHRIGERLVAVIDCFRGGGAMVDAMDTLTVCNERLAVVLGPAPVRVAPGRAVAKAACLEVLKAAATIPSLPVLFTSGHNDTPDPGITLSKRWQLDELAPAWTQPP